MIWDIFDGASSAADPRIPQKYLGSVNVPEKIEDGIDVNLMKLDLHLRKTVRHAYGEGYKMVSKRKPYTAIRF